MDCEKCGSEIPEAAEACPECGEPTATEEAGPVDAVAEEAGPVDAVADDPAVDDAFFAKDDGPTIDGVPVDFETDMPDIGEDERPGAINKKAAVIALVVVLVLAALGAVAFLLPIGGSTLIQKMTGNTNDPGVAAANMLAAYAKYDAKGILATTNAGSLPADSVKEFEKQAADAKTRAGGKDGVKNVKVIKVTIDSKDPKKATVDISADWLEDPEKGTYTNRQEPLPMVQQNGKWVVQLF